MKFQTAKPEETGMSAARLVKARDYAQRVSDETIRQTLLRLGVKWKRAKHWITSPDPGYERKKLRETG